MAIGIYIGLPKENGLEHASSSVIEPTTEEELKQWIQDFNHAIQHYHPTIIRPAETET